MLSIGPAVHPPLETANPRPQQNQIHLRRWKRRTRTVQQSLETTGASTQEKDPVCSINPLETSRASPHPAEEGVNRSLPNFNEVEGEVTPGDADASDTIAKALLDALQEKRAGNNLPPESIPRIRAAQLQQCLLTGRGLSDKTILATLELISLEKDTLGPANLADKVSTVSHT